MRFLLFAIGLLAFSSSATHAEMVTLDAARRAAATFVHLTQPGWSTEVAVADVVPLDGPDGSPVGYVAELAPSGFVLLAADTRIEPVVAYALSGDFPRVTNPGGELYDLLWRDLAARMAALGYTSAEDAECRDRNAELWAGYVEASPKLARVADAVISKGPLLQTLWTQSEAYSRFCPIDPRTGERSAAGCVAIAIGQICAYWKYPAGMEFRNELDSYVTGSAGIRIPEDHAALDFPSFETLNVALDTIRYDEDPTEVANFCFAVGARLGMDYGSGSSAALTNVAALGFSRAGMMNGWGDSQWDTVVEEIDAGRPLLVNMTILRDGNGHAAVIDGYRYDTSRYLHINMGAGGDVWYAPVNTIFETVNIIHGITPRSATTTLTREESPHEFDEDVVVEAGETLRIEAGAELVFAPGGAIQVKGGWLDVFGTTDNPVLLRTRTAAGQRWGGFLFTDRADVRIEHAIITDAEGPVIQGLSGRLHIRESAVVGTYCAGNTPIVDFQGGAALIEDCTIAHNSSGSSPTIRIDRARLSLRNCTMAGNLGSGFVNIVDRGTTTQAPDVSLMNCVAWGNSGPLATGRLDSFSVAFSDVQGGWTGEGNIDVDPLFVDAAAGDYALAAASPCRNAGDPQVVDADGSRSDMGAFRGDQQPAIGPPPLPRIVAQNPVWLGGFTPGEVTIQNLGVADLILSNLSLPSDFSTSATFPITIERGSSVSVLISYAGTARCVRTATLTHNDTYANPTDITLVGGVSSQLSGPLSGVLPKGTYAVIDRISVLADDTLTIEAGSEILFDTDVPLVVDGVLTVAGAAADSIRFVAGAADAWGGLFIRGNGAATLGHTRISGGSGLRNAGSVELTDCTVSNNEAESYIPGGGGVYNEGDATLVNCSITGNLVGPDQSGTGVYNSGDMSLTNCTVAGNGPEGWSGIVHESATGLLENCIVTGGMSTGGSCRVAALFCDVEGGWPGVGNVDADPMFANPAGGDYTLQPGSPCIDTGMPYVLDRDGSASDMGYTGGDGDIPELPRVGVLESVSFSSFASGEITITNIGSVNLQVTGIAFSEGFSSTITFPAIGSARREPCDRGLP